MFKYQTSNGCVMYVYIYIYIYIYICNVFINTTHTLYIYIYIYIYIYMYNYCNIYLSILLLRYRFRKFLRAYSNLIYLSLVKNNIIYGARLLNFALNISPKFYFFYETCVLKDFKHVDFKKVRQY